MALDKHIRAKRIRQSWCGAVAVFAIILSVLMGFTANVADAEEASVPETIQVRPDIPYTAPWSATQTQKLDFYSLRAWNSSGDGQGHPLVVFIHGGAWVHGDKSMSDRMPLVSILLKSGYAVASIDYRLADESPWPAQINDCKSAIRFLRANAQSLGVDGKKIAVFGESAGAHLAMLMDETYGEQFVDTNDGNGTVSSDIQAVISDYGISNVAEWGTSSHDDSASAAYAKNLLLGAGYTNEEAMLASPIEYVNADAKPILLVHGKNDSTVDYRQTVALERSLRAVGAKSVYSWYPDNGPHSSVDIFVKNIEAQLMYLDFLSNVMPSEETADEKGIVSVTRMYNTANGVHMFSISKNEINVLNQDWTGWRDEGHAFYVRQQAVTGSQNVTRLHNPLTDDYLYTTDESEVASLRVAGWYSEGVFFARQSGGVPVYQLYNPNAGQHMLVTSQKELNNLMSQGWIDEGVAFHAYEAV